MGRTRIIIESENNDDMDERLKRMESQLEEIRKKQSSPWSMSVILIIITAVMTTVNYFIQRSFVNSDLYSNKVKEKIAEVRALETIDFYKKTITKIAVMDENFE